MEDLSAFHIPEMAEFKAAVKNGQEFSEITRLVHQEVERQTEKILAEFSEAIAHTNLAALDIMQAEIARVKEDSATIKGAMERLKIAAMPSDFSQQEEVVSFRQAIDNLEIYGNIIPSSKDISVVKEKARKSQEWTLFRQSLARVILSKLEEAFFGNRTVS